MEFPFFISTFATMKKIMFALFGLLIITSCESNQKNNLLRQQRHEIETQIAKLQNIIIRKEAQVKRLDVELKERHIALEGRKPQYCIKYRLHFSNLDSALRHGLRDAQNTEFEIPVSRFYFKNSNIGRNIVDEGGGFFESRAHVTVEVTDKYIK